MDNDDPNHAEKAQSMNGRDSVRSQFRAEENLGVGVDGKTLQDLAQHTGPFDG